MLTEHVFPRRSILPGWLRPRPRILALFSFRYDAHLVPDLVENIRPIVDGYVAYDDRGATEPFSAEPARRRLLRDRARALGAGWALCIDPDERLEEAAATRLRALVREAPLATWGFRLRELYAPDAYRVDGPWARKIRYRLFPLIEGQVFDDRALHGQPGPLNGPRRRSGLNLYHLKSISPARRRTRRDLYNALDPDRRHQPSGYDYLADDEGAVLEPIPPGRSFRPPHRDDGGLWMCEVR